MEQVRTTPLFRKGGYKMKKPDYFIGIDVGSQALAISVGTHPWRLLETSISVENSTDGFEDLLTWLNKHNYTADNAIVCMETTGVYSQSLSYFLASNNYSLAVEPPLKVKRAFPTHGHKNDVVDSQHLAEYAYRFFDELHLWRPPDSVLKQVKTLLNTREQLTKNRTAYKNTLKALMREVVRTDVAERMYKNLIDELKSLIKKIDEEIRNLIDQYPFFNHMFRHMLSVPSVGLQLASNILVLTQGRDIEPNARQLSAYVGICPYGHSSGTTVYRRSRSSRNGPGSVRRLLYLAALSLRTHDSGFKEYYLRKTKEGKAKKLVINNIQNKLLRVICAVLRTNRPYIRDYTSLHPEFIKTKKCA